MQNGSLIRSERQRGPDVWEFRWRELAGNGKRTHRRIVIGSVDRLADEAAARQAVSGLHTDMNAGDVRHGIRYEICDRNPIQLVRQSAKRKAVPVVLTPTEVQRLLSALALRERTLVLVAFGTGLRMSELFALKWRDVNFQTNEVSIVRSIVFQVLSPCKTEVPRNQSHRIVSWPTLSCYGASNRDIEVRMIGYSQVLLHADNILIGASASCELSSGRLQ